MSRGLGLGIPTATAARRLLEVARGNKCPVTGGHAMRVTDGAWKKMCAKMRTKGVSHGMDGMCSKPMFVPYTACEQCRGQRIPKEVSIIKQAELRVIQQQINVRREQPEQTNTRGSDDMASKKRFSDCDICGEKANVFMNHGIEMCSTCANLCTHVRNRLPLVAFAAVTLGVHSTLLEQLVEQSDPGWFVQQAKQYLPEQVTVELAKGPLDAIAELVGYIGEDADGLVKEVRKLVASAMSTSNELEQVASYGLTAMEQITQRLLRRESALWSLVAAYEELQADRDEVWRVYNQLFDAIKEERTTHHNFRVEIYRALSGLQSMPIPGDETLVRMAAESEATLEQIARSTGQIVGLHLEPNNVLQCIAVINAQKDQHSTFLISLRQALDKPIGPVDELLAAVRTRSELLEEYRSAINATTCLAEDAEQKLLADEQVFSRLREVLGDDSLANGDLPTAVQIALGGASIQSPNPGTSTGCQACEDRLAIDTIISLLSLEDGATHQEILDAVRSTWRARSIDSRILDLAIDYHIPIERVAELRGVA